MTTSMPQGETNTTRLLKNLSPVLDERAYVFLTFQEAKYGEHCYLEPIGSFREKEGLSLIVPQDHADKHGFEYHGVFKNITLQVHSSLEALGLTSVISTRLARCGISANVIAGFFHDHVFVPERDAKRALIALVELTKN